MSELTKIMVRVDPPRSHPVEESERHYLGVHTAIARQGSTADPDKIGYHTRKVLRQYDRLGGWSHRLTAWRFVSNWVRLPEGQDRSAAAMSVLGRAMELDVVHCVRGLRRCVVDESVLFDARSGQTSGATYLFEYDRGDDLTPGAARDKLTQIAKTAAESLAGYQGARLLTLNLVLHESETRPVAEPGQLFTGRLREDTDKVGFVEFVFDSAYWGDRYFARPETAALLLDTGFSTAAGYHVAETIEFDRR